MISKRIVGLAAGLAVVGVTAAGCGDKSGEPFQDADRSDVVNRQPVDVITNADGFSNMATKCDHGNRLYTAFHGDGAYGSVTVVPRDPSCRGDISVAAAGAGN